MKQIHNLNNIYLLLIFLAKVNGGSKTLSDKVSELEQLSAERPVIRLNYQKFQDYVKSVPRNYSMMIMFTALAPARQCSLCHLASTEFAIVARSYRDSPIASNKLFFGMVDFDDASEVFTALKLSSAPVFMHFPSKNKMKKDKMDLNINGLSAEAIASFIHSHIDIKITIQRKPSYSGIIAVITLGTLLAGFLYLRRNNLGFLYNKQLWGTIALLFCFAMISGQMWNHIRNPPFLQRTQNGGISYIYGSSHIQFIIESYIVMFLNAMIALGMILLIESGSQNDMRKGRVMAITGLILLAVFYSLLLSVFRSKAHGYPYSFLFK